MPHDDFLSYPFFFKPLTTYVPVIIVAGPAHMYIPSYPSYRFFFCYIQ